MGGFCGRLNEGRIRDSLLEVEERETDAVLDENGEVLGFHHDRPADEKGYSALRRRDTGGLFLGIFLCGGLWKGDIDQGPMGARVRGRGRAGEMTP